MISGCCNKSAQDALNQIEKVYGFNFDVCLDAIGARALSEGRDDVYGRIAEYQRAGALTQGDVYRLYAFTFPPMREAMAVKEQLDPAKQGHLRHLIEVAYAELPVRNAFSAFLGNIKMMVESSVVRFQRTLSKN